MGELSQAMRDIAAFHKRNVNCKVKVYQDVQRLEAGQPRGNARETLLESGLAFFVRPRRDWQQAAAVEGLFGGSVKILSCEDLSGATRVIVTDHDMAGTYKVNAASTTGGQMWRLELDRRKTL